MDAGLQAQSLQALADHGGASLVGQQARGLTAAWQNAVQATESALALPPEEHTAERAVAVPAAKPLSVPMHCMLSKGSAQSSCYSCAR